MYPAFAILLATLPAQAADTVVVCPTAWRPAMAVWEEHRTAQGHGILWVEPATTARGTKERIVEVASGREIGYLLLVGDAVPVELANPARPSPPGNDSKASHDRPVTPTWRRRAQVNIAWGSEPFIATDAPYADWDNNGIPEVAVGRWSVHSQEELARLVQKTLRFESASRPGEWLRQVDVVGGVGGFGQMTDRLLENVAASILSRGVPRDHALRLSYANEGSRYAPSPARIQQVIASGLCGESLLWVYLGHGNRDGLDEMRLAGKRYPLLTRQTVEGWPTSAGQGGIAFLAACHTGAFDSREDCLAETLTKRPAGPVATISSSRVSMPYGNTMLALGLLQAFYDPQHENIGQVFLAAKQNLLEESAHISSERAAINLLARLIHPQGPELAAERLEHHQMYNLLGDPLLRIPRPVGLTLTANVAAKEASVLSSVQCREGGVCLFEWLPKDRSLGGSVPKTEHDLAANLTDDQADATWLAANRRALSSWKTSVSTGGSTVRLPAPHLAPGDYLLRCTVSGKHHLQIGVTSVTLD